MEVNLRGQGEPVTLAEVEVDDADALVGTTRTGKRFVTLRSRVRGNLPIRHPYRVYLRGGAGFRSIDPSFPDAEEWFLRGDGKMDFTVEDGREVTLEKEDVLSLLSATPEDEAATIAGSN